MNRNPINLHRTRISLKTTLACMAAAFMISSCTVSVAQNTKKSPVAGADYYTVPVLKQMNTNPVQRIRIYIPENTQTTYTQLTASLNTDAVKAVERIDVYFTGHEPLFNAKALAGSAMPLTADFSIPINVMVKPGWNYIWLSPVLKTTADIDTKIILQSHRLSGTGGMLNIASSSAPVKNYTGVAIRKANDENVHTFRIPGLITTDKGTLIAVYDIRYDGSKDLPANIDVGMSRSTDGGRSWEPMKVIMDMGGPKENSGIGDPAILFDPVTKTLWCAALWSKGDRSIWGSKPGLSPDESGQFVLVKSEDDGKTWSAPINITAQVKNPIWHLYFNGPGSGIAMQNGKLVFASQYWDETTNPSRVGIPYSSIIYSDDHGKTWKSGIGAKSNTTEAQIVETTPGTLMLNMRDNRGGFRSVATTKDMGKTWVEHPTSFKDLVDPVCQGSIIKAKVNAKGKKQDVLFFSNVSDANARIDMTVRASLDLGETWKSANARLVDMRKTFGYSCLTKIDDNTLGILYEGERDLFFIRIPVSDIIR